MVFFWDAKRSDKGRVWEEQLLLYSARTFSGRKFVWSQNRSSCARTSYKLRMRRNHGPAAGVSGKRSGLWLLVHCRAFQVDGGVPKKDELDGRLKSVAMMIL